ncbi:MAG: bifunctional NADP phosphatase/NAD kinase [Methanobrevibacter sp.]|jgi:NAD+ kinase|nr:bifunctional NADP phosphatase/NAD kinase [Candidatus Methanovirga basalitermitum]
MIDTEIEKCREISYKIMEQVEIAIKAHQNENEAGEFIKIGADGTDTKKIDEYAEKEVVDVLKSCDFLSYLISEEIGEMKLGKNSLKSVNIIEDLKNSDDLQKAKFVFVIDPLDGTANALKRIPAYGISIAIAKIKERKLPRLEDIQMGFIKDFYSGDLYEAVKNKGAKINFKKPSYGIITTVEKATLGGYINLEEDVFNLLKGIRRMRLIGSVAIEFAYLSQGKYDIFMDLRGSRILDIAAAKLIVEESGAIITDKEGRNLRNDLNIYEKVVIVGSTNKSLHRKVIKELNRSNKNFISLHCQDISIGIVSRLDSVDSILFSAKVIDDLIKRGIKIKVEKALSDLLNDLNKTYIEDMIEDIHGRNEPLYNQLKDLELKNDYSKYSLKLSKFDTDILFTLGGDGTILNTIRQLSSAIPIFAVNMGTVGFLTEIEIEDYDENLEKLLKGEYYREKRSQVKVSRGRRLFSALNEIVIMTEKPAKMLHFEVKVDGDIIERFRADGLILATPSGSTAYSMSAGGPIVDPKVSAFLIIPICPYKLGIRPFVVSDKSDIRIKLLKKYKKAVLVIDGQTNLEIDDSNEIQFTKSQRDVYFIRTDRKELYQKVKEKLTEDYNYNLQ